MRKVKIEIDKCYFLRKIDELGRVVLPIEIREALKIKEADPLETTLEQLRIIADSLKMLALQV